jgi:hypothetical protein
MFHISAALSDELVVCERICAPVGFMKVGLLAMPRLLCIGELARNGHIRGEICVKHHSRSFDEGKQKSFFGDSPAWTPAFFKYPCSELREWSVVAAPTVLVVTSSEERKVN